MRTPAPLSYLRLIIGIFFVAIGVFAIIDMQTSSVILGQDIYGVSIVFGVVEVIGGLALVVEVFTTFRIAYVLIIGYVLFYFWILKILLNIISLAVPGFPSTAALSLGVTDWIVSFALQLAILSGLYIVNRDYSQL